MEMIQIQEVAQAYRYLLPVQTQQTSDMRVHPHGYEALQHCAWMCDEILSGKLEREKAMRWLCFVQGCFWVMGVKTIASMKEDNRPTTDASEIIEFRSSYPSNISKD